ncbi:4-hydroxy-3-polyprenylbenzoate decarboxylase [Thermodesulfitimonas autotrophica]|uniref:Flavin prenyltransferase UbiX n=1 Tax=Thermodesulfitimonas autotrophica TaxID=1894989 RepID=A0A3N5AWW0_9THEO|nr:UbiX family flavin prenyltransferase [Thermodesulfitimonas autotrophica]RPF49746.1 4-hydroxy-3-polyprenylbenzoate decarboxylase [Thermodesulfitimonas autotrophica]
MRIIVGITGASGVIYGISLLEALRQLDVETHLILSQQAERLITAETAYAPEEVRSLAAYAYAAEDLHAPVASGSFPCQGMVVAPCSMKTLAGIAGGYAENLIQRAADVTLKEGRRLILMPRESPFSAVHLENMLKLARLGVIIAPPVPAFYTRPQTINDLVRFSVGRVLDLLGIEHRLFPRWGEDGAATNLRQEAKLDSGAE